MRRSLPPSVPLLVLAVAAAGAWLARAASAPSAAIETVPPNPSAGQDVMVREGSSQASAPFPGSWWDFGDGQSSELPAPVHVWEAPGVYTVRLISPSGASETGLVVSARDTLRLLPAHPFEMRLEVRDPSSGEILESRASAWTDRQGSFGFPQTAGESGHPLVVVKLLDDGERYAFFWSGMTSLDYTLTIREVATGRVAVHRKEGSELAGGSDTATFRRDVVEGPSRPSPRALGPRGMTATATPVSGVTVTPPTVTLTRTPSTTRTATRTATSTVTTPTPTATVTVTPTTTPTPTITLTPTITPTPLPPFVALRAIQWQWSFCPSSDGYACPEVCPAPCGREITLRVGQTYRIWVYNGDDPDVIDSHSLSTISGVGLVGGDLPPGGSLPVQWITPMTPGNFAFNCTTFCGSQVGHDGMTGVIHVVP